MPNHISPKRQAIVPIGPSIAYIPLTRGMFSLICREDSDDLSKNNWCSLSLGKGRFYAVRRSSKTQEKPRGYYTFMHREILGLKAGEIGDHINGSTLDNRRDNLRNATTLQNVVNSRVRSDSSSGLKGAFLYTTPNLRNPWYSRIKVKGKIIGLGSFSTALEAHEAYRLASIKYFGEFARV